ncbi:protein PIN-LIKES 3-like [Prosopis cineraria]|uniref:protein PIN-LIKES 3-like n=1 Tax=Prosopis cineraria TaxID=364024 RepID=UPI00240FBF3A|nr:protein PIN-LIKES 3-like [Prosopis cineraria]
MEFWKLFIVALMPVLKVLLVTAVGAFIALDCFDILKDNARKPLNSMVYYVFTPALLSSNLAKTLTLKSLVILWFMPINILLSFTIGTAFGWLIIKITRTPRHLQGLVLGCCSAGNVGNLPLIIVPAVCKESSGAFGDVEACYRNGMAYVSMSMAIGSIYIWCYVYNIVRIYTCEISNINRVDDSTVASVSAAERDPENLSACSTGQLVNVGKISQENDQMGQLEIECTNRQAKVIQWSDIINWNMISLSYTFLLCCRYQKGKDDETVENDSQRINLKALFAPSTTGSIVGMVIGAVAPLQKVLIGDNAPLHVVQDSASMIGDAAVPAITLLIGANLLKGLKGSGMQTSLIVGVIIVRFIALPAVGVGIVKGAVHFGWLHPDPLYQFVLLLQFALPPAVAISTMTQLFGVGVGECSVIMLATYSCATVSLTLWCAFFMWLVL